MSLVLYVSAIGCVVVLLSLLLALSFQQSFFASAIEEQMAARNLAESALQQSMVTVLRSPAQNWGAGRRPAEYTLVSSTFHPKAYGIVSFNAAVARDRKVPLSNNNLRGGSVVSGSLDREVPINTVQLVARGVCGDSVKTLEMLFYVPPFPNALASEGPIRSSGGLLVGAVSDPSKFTGSFRDLPPEEQLPAHIVSNSNSPEAVKLGPGARIMGNVGAVGGVVLDSSVEVSGMVRQHLDPQPIPKLDLTRLFERLGGQIGSDALDPDLPSLQLAWNAHCDTPLVVHGNLNLDGGVLVVHGDLTVQGGIFGKGAIFVDGRTLVLGGASFHSSDQVALVSRQRITLNGAGRESSFFQGMMYSDEDIVASDVTVLGAVIARGIGGLELNNVSLINSPVTIGLVDGLELPNYSDDDTVQVVIRVQSRDPKTRKPLSYRLQFSGRSDEPRNPLVPVQWSRLGQNVSVPEMSVDLKGYDEIRAFMSSNMDVGRGYAKNAYRSDWYWNNRDAAGFTRDPLRDYLDRLEGKQPDPSHVFTLNLDPNEALGLLDRSRVLLWREVAN